MILPPGFRLARLLRAKEMGEVQQFSLGKRKWEVGEGWIWKLHAQAQALSNSWSPETITLERAEKV